MTALSQTKRLFQGIVLPVAGETVGIAGADEFSPAGPELANTLGSGTAVAALTPRFPISVEPKGIPARVPLVVVDAVVVGLDDAATLLEPEPHIPVNPDVSTIPEDVDSPDVDEIAVEVDIPDVAMPAVIVAVAGVVVPFAIAIPPPS
jgi:hypothetical protein